MKVCELSNELCSMGIPNAAYSINSVEFPNEAYVIFWNGSEWEVYYSERGQKSGIKKFINEAEACEHFMRQISRMW